MNIKNIKNQQAFTLVEILVSLSIFSLMVLAVSGIYIAFNNSQIRTTASQQLLNDSQYIMELMAREIRNSSIISYTQDSSWCNGVIKTWATTFTFDDCIILERENGQIFTFTTFKNPATPAIKSLQYLDLNNCGEDYMSCDSWKDDVYALTPLLSQSLNNINIESLSFKITPTADPFPEGSLYNQQPKVTINMTTSYISGRPIEKATHTFQTTVSSRVYKR